MRIVITEEKGEKLLQKMEKIKEFAECALECLEESLDDMGHREDEYDEMEERRGRGSMGHRRGGGRYGRRGSY